MGYGDSITISDVEINTTTDVEVSIDDITDQIDLDTMLGYYGDDDDDRYRKWRKHYYKHWHRHHGDDDDDKDLGSRVLLCSESKPCSFDNGVWKISGQPGSRCHATQYTVCNMGVLVK